MLVNIGSSSPLTISTPSTTREHPLYQMYHPLPPTPCILLKIYYVDTEREIKEKCTQMLIFLCSPPQHHPNPTPFFSFSFFLSLFLCVQKTTPQQQSSLEYTGKEVDHILPFNVSCSLPASIQCTTFYQSPWSALLKQDFNSLTRFKPFHYLAHRLVIAPL